MAQGAEADAYAQGVHAYVWGYPLVRMKRVARQYTEVPANNAPTSYRARLNEIGWARDLATAASKDRKSPTMIALRKRPGRLAAIALAAALSAGTAAAEDAAFGLRCRPPAG